MSDYNWHTEALLRGAKTVPEWWTKVGRDNVYALKWTTGAVDWYQSDMVPAPINFQPDGGFTFWFKITQALVAGDGDVGLFGFVQAGSRDLIAVHIHHVAGRGNVLTATVKTSSGAYQFVDSQTNFGSAGLGETWHNFTYEITGGAGLPYIDGTPLTTSFPLALHADVFTNTDPVYLGAASLTAGLHLSAKHVIMDEWAFAEGNKMSPTLAYNSGVPKVWNTTDNPEIVGWYPLDKNVGAVTNRGLYNYITGGAAYPNFLWSVVGTTGRPSVVTDALRKTDTNAYFQLATNYGDWVKGGTVDGRQAIGANQVTVVSPALMTPPAGGGFSTMGYTGAFIGNHEEPFATPIFSTATTVLSSMDSTAYVASGGTGSLTAITNNKTSRKLFPAFVRKV
tara:strand:- start:840 stop:2021 length:1182 start_codon:yes stop_codon:yes gene_type:complete